MMKRFLILLLTLVMLLPAAVACSGNGDKPDSSNTTGSGSTSGTETSGNIKDDENMLYTWMNNGYNKVLADGEVPEVRENTHTVYMTKTEMEGCQISLRSPEDVKGLTVEVSELNGITASVSLEKTQKIAGERWPDGLLPLDKIGSFDLSCDITTTLYVQFKSENAPAGDQACKITVNDSEGKTFATFDVTVHVWDILLDDKYRTDSWIPLSWEAIAKEYGLGDLRGVTLSDEDMETLRGLYKSYYDLLLDYGICGGELPYDLLDERADAYLDDPRVTVFTIGAGEVDEEKLVAYYNKIKDNPTWLAKAVYYSLDEPTTNEMLEELARRSALVNKLAPGVKTISSFYDNFSYDANTDATTFMMNNLDIIVPKLCLFDRVGGMENYKKRMDAYKESGNKQVYTYVCWEPWKPYLNVFVNENGIDHRILFWQIYDCEADGFLYWAANQWYDLDVNPWYSMQTIPWLTRDVYGDGSLMYPGNKFGFDDPCSSLRLEAIRDGLEDNRLLKMAEEYLGSEYVDKKVDKITRSPALSTSDSSLFDEIRKDIGDALEQKLTGNA